MRNNLKRTLAFAASTAMCGSMLLYFPGGTFNIGLPVSAAEGDVAISEENFPDEIFRNYVDENFDTTDDDILTAEEIAAATEIDVFDMGISDLTGVECFTALNYLECSYNSLTSLDVSNNTELVTLYCSDNALTSLDVSQNTALTYLDCSDNALTSLDVSGCTALTNLSCSFNSLTSLDVSNSTVLEALVCHCNSLTSLDVSNNTVLETLICYGNSLTSLDVSNNTALKNLSCVRNSLTSLDVSNNTELFALYCDDNSLTSLDVSQNTTLMYLGCGSNQLTSLDVSNNTALEILYCDSNQLTSLDVSRNTALTYLDCSDNALTSLDVSGCTALIDLYCSSNQLWKLDFPENYSGELNFDAENTITVADKTLDLSAYGLEAANFSGGALDENGILTPDTIPGTVTYTDTLANGDTMTIYVAFGVAVNEENFPDEIFRNYVDENFDTTDDDMLTAEEIAAATEINVSEMGISDLTGVEYFTALEYLLCYSNSLTSLDVSQNTALKYLSCDSNQLTGLDVSGCTALTNLDCCFNSLTSLDVSNNTALKSLVCYSNSLTSLDVSNNTALETLICHTNSLTSLDVSNNTALTYLSCGSNLLTSLDVSQNTALEILYCDYNQLTSLDLCNNTALTDLYCNSNRLTSLDLSNNTALTNLIGSSNSYEIDLVGGTFDLSTLPDGFDVTKATGWINETVDGNTLTVFDPTQAVIYTYDLGNGSTETFALNPVSCTITEDMVSAIANQTYTGEAIEPSATVMCGVAMLTLDTDYTISYENNLNAGTASATIKGTGTFYKGEVTVRFTIEKAVPEYTIPTDLTATYGDTLADVTLPEGFTWQDDETTSVGNAGTNTFKVTFTPDDTDNYEIVEDIEVTIEVAKAVPEIASLPLLTATYGDTLADVTLPEGFTWQDEETTSVGNAGTNTFKVTFTPDDTANYEIVEDIEVVIDVAKAAPVVTPVIPDGEYKEGDELPEIDYESEISGIIEWITELIGGLIEGENELEWQFTPDDEENYEIVTGTAVVEAQATTTTTTTSSTTTTTTTTVPTTTSTTTTATTTVPTTTSTTATTTVPTTTSTTTTSSTTTTATTTVPTTTSTTTTSSTTTTTTSSTTTTTTTSTTTTTTSGTTTSTTTTSTTTTTTDDGGSETTTSTTTTTDGDGSETTTTTTTDGDGSETTTTTTTDGDGSETTTSTTTTTDGDGSETTTSSTTTTTPPVATTVVTGDAENDGDVDTSDANKVLDYIDGLIAMFGSTVEEHEAIADAVDVDGDGAITKTDAALILGYAAQQGITWDELVSTIIPAADIDMTALNAKLAEAEAIINDGTYTEESYAALQEAIEAVRAAQNAEDLPSGYAEQMTNLLNAAIEGLEENLPQTGYSVVYNYIMLAAAAMVLFGAFAMTQSRKRDEE